MEKIVKISELHDFKGNPYGIRDNEDMEQLVESIKENGVIETPIVRPLKTGGYEILSGHRRKYACMRLGINEIKVDVREMDRDMAIITMVDSNLQRTDILPSERAYAYKMKLDAMKNQGKRNDLSKIKDDEVTSDLVDRFSNTTSSHVGTKLQSAETIGKEIGVSKNTIYRYIRLTYLEKPILELVDNDLMAISPAVEISFLTKQEQEDLIETMESEDRSPSYSQAIRMHKLSEQGKLDMDKIFEIMTEEKPNQKEQIKLPVDSLQKYFPREVTPDEMIKTIQELLEKYQRNWQRQRNNRDAR